MNISRTRGQNPWSGRSSLIVHFVVLVVLVVALLFLAWFKRSPDRVEAVFSQGFFPVLGKVQQVLLGWVPFSVGDMFYAAVVACGGVLLIRMVRYLLRREWGQVLPYALRITNLSLLLYVVFYVFWGLSYFRVPLERQLGLETIQPGISDLIEVAYTCVDSVNALREQWGDGLPAKSNKEIYAESSRLLRDDTKLPTTLLVYKPKVKSPLVNTFGNYMGVSGYFNPYTHEAHVNSSMPVWARPFTACHELAHQAGIGFEDEANYIGFVLAHQSDDDFFRYSAYYTVLWMVLGDLYRYDRTLYQELFEQISPRVIEDVRAHQAYWEHYLGLFNTVTQAFYGQYLKANNQPEGLQRYDRMVRLLVAAHIRDGGCG